MSFPMMNIPLQSVLSNKFQCTYWGEGVGLGLSVNWNILNFMWRFGLQNLIKFQFANFPDNNLENIKEKGLYRIFLLMTECFNLEF